MSQYQQFFAEIINKGLVPLAMLAGGGYLLFLLLQTQQSLIQSVCERGLDRVTTQVQDASKLTQDVSNAQKNLVPIVMQLLNLQKEEAKRDAAKVRGDLPPARSNPLHGVAPQRDTQ